MSDNGEPAGFKPLIPNQGEGEPDREAGFSAGSPLPPRCQVCGKATWNVDDYDEPLCNSCADNRNEYTYEQQQEILMETGGYPTLRDQQIEAMKLKR